MRPESGFRIAINWKQDNDVTICWHDIIINFTWCCHVSLINFSHWSKFHVNIITGSGVMTISIYKALTRNLEIGIPPPEFCPNSGDWGELGIPHSARMSLIKCYWMLQNVRVNSFYRFWVIKGKPTWGEGNPD